MAEREIRDTEERLSGRFWTVGVSESGLRYGRVELAHRGTGHSRRRSLAGLGRVWVTLG